MRARAGFTLIELMVASTILALIGLNMAMVSKSGSRAIASEAFRTSVEEEADLTAERVRKALLSAAANTLEPLVSAPLGSPSIRFQTVLGVSALGEPEHGDPERIAWEAHESLGRVLWTTAPDLPEERTLVWSKAVPPLSLGELPNGLDDNENGLADEPGLVFALEESPAHEAREVSAHLTIERRDKDGRLTPSRRMVRVTCRN